MATIITVHGTGVHGNGPLLPEEGERWWQKGSEFESHVRELVEGVDGKLEFRRLIWSGANSEVARRKADTELLRRMRQLEANNEKYCVIGHSHGGSVISSALVRVAKKVNSLPGLTRCITVGTPFIAAKRRPFLFSRLGLIGKSLYTSTLLFFLILTVTIMTPWILWGFQPLFGWSAIVVSMASSIAYLAFRTINSRNLVAYRVRNTTYASKHFAVLLVSLFHRADEAIQGLGSLRRLNIRFFGKDFAVPLFSLGSLLVLPAVMVSVFSSSYIIGVLLHRLDQCTGTGYDLKTDPPDIWNRLLLVSFVVNHAYICATTMVSEDMNFNWWDIPVTLTLLLLIPLILFSISMAATYLVSKAATIVSYVLSVNFNKLTWGQIRRTALGGDALGEIPLDVQDHPTWTNRRFSPLPMALSAEISLRSDEAAARSLSKFRDALSELVVSEDKEAKSFLFSEYLTWDELIHTSYFRVPRFRMLIAYAIAHSEGFRPTEAFKNHPDYNLVAGWYEEIKPQAAQGSP